MYRTTYHLLFAVLGPVCASFQIILTTPLYGKCCYFPPVTDEDTGAQKSEFLQGPTATWGIHVTRTPAPKPLPLRTGPSWPLRWRNRLFCGKPESATMHSAWVSGQTDHPVDFGLVILLKGMSQFLKINLFPSVHTSYWSCFSGEG